MGGICLKISGPMYIHIYKSLEPLELGQNRKKVVFGGTEMYLYQYR